MSLCVYSAADQLVYVTDLEQFVEYRMQRVLLDACLSLAVLRFVRQQIHLHVPARQTELSPTLVAITR